METLNDPVFGDLNWDEHWWRRNYGIKIFGENKKVSLKIDADIDQEIKHQQREVFIQFDQNKEKCIREMENSLYEYYLSILDEKRADFEDVADEFMPIVSDVNGLKDLVPLKTILIRQPYMESKRIIFLFDCTWDDSHGVGLQLSDNKVEVVGEQDLVL